MRNIFISLNNIIQTKSFGLIIGCYKINMCFSGITVLALKQRGY